MTCRALACFRFAVACALAIAASCTVDASEDLDADPGLGRDAWAPSPDAAAQPDAEADDCPNVRVATEESNLNIREEPNTESEVIGSLPKDTVVEVLDRVEGEVIQGDSEWFHIEHEGTIGYISGAFAACTTAEPSGAEIAPPSDPAPAVG